MPVVRIKTVSVCRLFLLLALTSPGVVCANSLLFADAAVAQSTAIRAINVDGNRRVEPETVRSYLQFSVGDAYDPAKVDRSLKALFATGLFSDVRIDRNGADVIVTIVENPVINQIAFEGNSEVDTETLRKRGAAQAALGVHARPRPVRRPAHPRRLSPPGPLCRDRRAEDHRARAETA